MNNTTFPKKYFFTRLINLFSYFILCFFRALSLRKMDCVIAETDPPLLASIAYIYSRLHKSRFIYYSQDIWPHAGLVNRKMTNPFLAKSLKAMNGFLYRKADRTIVPGRDMKQKLKEEFSLSSDKIAVVENWADPDQIYPVKPEDNFFLGRHSLESRFVVMYSGNIGLSQDLEKTIDTADRLKDIKDILFVFIGDGALKKKLMNMAATLGLRNVKFLSYQEKKDLKFSLNAADIHLIPLKEGMRGIIVPSKVYGILAAGKPFIAAVDEDSEIDKIVKESRCGLVVEPSSSEALEKAMLWAYNNQEKIQEMGKKGRQVLENQYTRKMCTQKFRSAVENVLQAT